MFRTTRHFSPDATLILQMHSQFKGVSRDARTNRWKAQLFIAGKNRHLGYYDTEEQAARMWDTVRVRLGEFFKNPVPKLNLGFEQLLDPYEILRLREQLEHEGATKYDLAFIAQGPSARVTKTRNQTADNSEPVETRRARLTAEAEELSGRLADVLAELNQFFSAADTTSLTNPYTSSQTGSL